MAKTIDKVIFLSSAILLGSLGVYWVMSGDYIFGGALSIGVSILTSYLYIM